MTKQSIINQRGFSLIIAIVILIIFAILAVMLTSLVTTDSDIAMYESRSKEALYIANSGQQYLMKQNYPPARVSTQINVIGSSGFIIDPPGALSADINSTAATIPAVCRDKGATVDCNTLFPSSGRILIESELIDYTGVGASSFTGATRGRGNSLATSHNTNKGIYHATALTASVTNAATTIPVSSTTGFIIPGTIKIDQEFLYCTGTTGGFSGCTRGTQGSQAMAHNAGASAIQITTTITGTVPTGIIGDAKRVLRAQAGIYMDGWAVGNTGTITRWNGINWDMVTSPTGQPLNSVFTLDTNSDGAADNGWAVGDRIAATTTGWTFLRWNSPTPGTWNQITIPATPRNAVNLNSVFMVSATDGWVVGNRRGCINPGPTILRWNGASWACPPVGVLPGSADQNLRSVYCNSSTDCWAVGNAGTILHWDGTSWSQYSSPTANQLNGIFLMKPQNFLRLADWQEVY